MFNLVVADHHSDKFVRLSGKEGLLETGDGQGHRDVHEYEADQQKTEDEDDLRRDLDLYQSLVKV